MQVLHESLRILVFREVRRRFALPSRVINVWLLFLVFGVCSGVFLKVTVIKLFFMGFHDLRDASIGSLSQCVLMFLTRHFWGLDVVQLFLCGPHKFYGSHFIYFYLGRNLSGISFTTEQILFFCVITLCALVGRDGSSLREIPTKLRMKVTEENVKFYTEEKTI